MFGLGKKSEESHEQGGNWGQRVFESGDTLTPEEAASLGIEYASDPQAFYDGYREAWNERASLWNLLNGK